MQYIKEMGLLTIEECCKILKCQGGVLWQLNNEVMRKHNGMTVDEIREMYGL